MTRPDDEADAAAATESPKWQAVFLVCKQCRKRKNGAKHVKAKALAKTIREHVREQRPRPKVLFTSCLGICPTSASAIAFVGEESAPLTLSVKSCDKLVAALPLLTGKPGADRPSERVAT